MHIFSFLELSLTLDSEQFDKQLLRIFKMPKEEYQLYSENNMYVGDALISKGITIRFNDKRYKKKIQLTVNVERILGNDVLNDKHISKLVERLEKSIDDYFHSEYGLNDFNLVKMGFGTDIDVHSRENVAAYLKVFKRIGKIKGFSPSSDSELSDDICFRLVGNSNGIDVMISDFESLVMNRARKTESKPNKLWTTEERTRGLLRTEIWLRAAKAVRFFSNGLVASEQIADLLEKREKIFFTVFTKIIPPGDYYKKNEAIEIIMRGVKSGKKRRKMLRLLMLIPEKKSLLLAQKMMNYRRIDKVMEAFEEINLSPVTISKRHEVKHLKNLYEFFL